MFSLSPFHGFFHLTFIVVSCHRPLYFMLLSRASLVREAILLSPESDLSWRLSSLATNALSKGAQGKRIGVETTVPVTRPGSSLCEPPSWRCGAWSELLFCANAQKAQEKEEELCIL